MAVWAPPPSLTVSEWADHFRVLSPEASAEPGKWRTERAEFQRGIMDALSDAATETVVVMKSAQVGWTEIINNVVGFHIHQDPAPILVVQPTVEMAEAWSKDRLAPMLRDSPVLAGKVSAPRSRDGANTLLHKSFAGGQLTIAGANSAASLASRPIRLVMFDEVDRYPASAGTEGDPITLGKKRTSTFWNRKVLIGSTPTVAGVSRVEKAYEDSDQRQFWVPCGHCGEPQTLKWAQVRWPEARPAKARYLCEGCGVAWSDAERWAAVRRGEWRAKGEFNGTAGFHISELYSPWRRLADVVVDFLAAKNRPEMLKTWINTALGEVWHEKGDAPDPVRLSERRDRARTTLVIPPGVLFLTAAADVQGNRLEWDVWGWGADFDCWLIDSGVVEGGPHVPEAWTALTKVVEREYQTHAGATMRIEAFGVDTGYSSHEVYRWVRACPAFGRVFALDGRPGVRLGPIGTPARVDVDYEGRKIGEVPLWPVGVHGLKLDHYGAIRRTLASGEDEAPKGVMHLPAWADETYCRQLCAEALTTVQPRGGGATQLRWVRLPGVRNERLDTAVYARALARHLTAQFTPAHWAGLSTRRLGQAAAPAGQAVPTALPAAAAARGRGVVGAGRRVV